MWNDPSAQDEIARPRIWFHVASFLFPGEVCETLAGGGMFAAVWQ